MTWLILAIAAVLTFVVGFGLGGIMAAQFCLEVYLERMKEIRSDPMYKEEKES